MFYYLSFLRPPPQSSLLSAPLMMTPQVSNDLRTEPFPGAADVFYYWIAASSDMTLTAPIKLTTWRESSAYKPLSIMPPPVRTRDARCTLALTSEATQDAHVIDLRRSSFGSIPLPVLSMPISFEGKATSTGKKQDSVERVFRLFDDAEDRPKLRIREMTSFDLDKKLWDSGLGLAGWLVQQAKRRSSVNESELAATAWNALFGDTRRRIIELGAGTGMVSLVLAALRSSRVDAESQEIEILSTDLPSSIELMEHNIRTNAPLYPHNPPLACVLDWGEDLSTHVRQVGQVDGFDIIIMADVSYNTASFPALVSTLSALLALRPSSPSLVLLAYKERDPAERDLWAMLRNETGISLEKICSSSGAGGQEVEIWLGRPQAFHT